MGHRYTEIVFTDSVKKLQTERHSRASYATMESGPDFNHRLDARESDFIAERDSFYMASVSESGWPYVQHRGGPRGFLKTLDPQTLGFADFNGNRQYVSTGNFRHNKRVSLILMDYPNQRRLKILGRVEEIPDSDWESLAALETPGFRASVERGFLIHIEGFDWNCPQFITPRFSEEEVQLRMASLQAENQRLLETIADHSSTQISPHETAIGGGPLHLKITAIRQLTPRVRAYELRTIDASPLPEIHAGAHLQVPVPSNGGNTVLRHYSICSNPERRDVYEIAVLREDEGSASQTIHRLFTLGMELRCERPANFFPLQEKPGPALLIAGGIGITPIKAMAQELESRGEEFQIHYAGRSCSEMAFRDRLQRQFGDRAHFYPADRQSRINIEALLRDQGPQVNVYVCGPTKLLEAVKLTAAKLDIADAQIHSEQFGIATGKGQPFQLILQKSGREISVSGDSSTLDAMLEAGIDVPHSCRNGQCRSCAVPVIQGDVEHRDTALSEADREQAGLMCPCVSRARSLRLTLDL